MVQTDHFVQVEDNRFVSIRNIGQHETPSVLHWCFEDDYLSQELYGFTDEEIMHYKTKSEEAYRLFERATEKIIQDKKLNVLGIPPFFHEVIERSWRNRDKHPFLIGRFDLNGEPSSGQLKVIEFNADTCSTLPESIYWQQIQLKELTGKSQFNNLYADLKKTLTDLRNSIPQEKAYFLASSFGYHEDIMNCQCILDVAKEAGFETHYENMEEVTFSPEEGIFYEINEQFIKADVWYKLAPWDWMYNEEFDLGTIVRDILEQDLCIILNPPHTTVWQNKRFLAYITENFPNSVIASTYLSKPSGGDFVEKPIFGRLGENVRIYARNEFKTNGDFKHQPKIFQKFYPLLKDAESYYYQVGIFYTFQPSALNLRVEDSPIITDNCGFVSHYVV